MHPDRGRSTRFPAKGGGQRAFGRAVLLTLSVLAVLIASACKSSPPSPMPTSTPSPSATVSPTTNQTSTISPTPTSTPVMIPQAYDLPAWMGDPNTVILTDLVMDEVLFLNASTGEQLKVSPPSETRGIFWIDNMHFGFLSNDLKTIHLVSLSTGQVSSIPASEQSTRLLDADVFYGNLLVKQDPVSPGEFVFDYASMWRWVDTSRNGHYSVYWDTTQDERQVVVRDIESQQVIWQSDPADGFSDYEYAWSPLNDSYLAVVQGRPDQTIDALIALKDITLLVLDVGTGEVISSHRGDIGSIVWSPDGTRILYRSALSLYWNFGYGFTEAPCIFNIQTEENACLWSIPYRPPSNGYSLLTTASYQWSPDGISVRFVYEYGSLSGIRGNLCVYNLLDGNIACPTDNLTGVEDWPGGYAGYGWSIHAYEFSPDGQFVHFCYSVNSLLSDDQGGPALDGLIKMDGSGFVSWAGQTFEQGNFTDTKCSAFGPIWRPLP